MMDVGHTYCDDGCWSYLLWWWMLVILIVMMDVIGYTYCADGWWLYLLCRWMMVILYCDICWLYVTVKMHYIENRTFIVLGAYREYLFDSLWQSTWSVEQKQALRFKFQQQWPFQYSHSFISQQVNNSDPVLQYTIYFGDDYVSGRSWNLLYIVCGAVILKSRIFMCLQYFRSRDCLCGIQSVWRLDWFWLFWTWSTACMGMAERVLHPETAGTLQHYVLFRLLPGWSIHCHRCRRWKGKACRGTRNPHQGPYGKKEYQILLYCLKCLSKSILKPIYTIWQDNWFRQSIPLIDNPLRKEILPNIQSATNLFKFETMTSSVPTKSNLKKSLNSKLSKPCTILNTWIKSPRTLLTSSVVRLRIRSRSW